MTIFDAIKSGKGKGEIHFDPVDATEPTSTMPGSAERIAELAARLGRGENLWHDEDESNLPSAESPNGNGSGGTLYSGLTGGVVRGRLGWR